MKQDKIMITTVPVTIRVIEVGGKRMTAAVFNQIQDDFFFFDEYDGERENMYLGWVLYKGFKYIVYHDKGTLKKDKFEPAREDSFLLRKYKDNDLRYQRSINSVYPNEREIKRLAIELELSKAEYEENVASVKHYNDRYSEWLTDDKQIFIAI